VRPTLFGATEYPTPPDAESRTVKVLVASLYEAWLLTTFTGWAGEKLWQSRGLPFSASTLKLTFRPGTLRRTEAHWLAERVLRLELATPLRQTDAGPQPDAAALLTTAEQAHRYLNDYDFLALVQDIEDVAPRVRMDLATRTLPPADDGLDSIQQHLRACAKCFRLTYLDEELYRRVAGKPMASADRPAVMYCKRDETGLRYRAGV
jgi:hypothetical protein